MTHKDLLSRWTDTLLSRRFSLYVAMSLAVHLLMGSFLLFATITNPSPSEMTEPIKVSLASRPPEAPAQTTASQSGQKITDAVQTPPEKEAAKPEKIEPPPRPKSEPKAKARMAPKPQRSKLASAGPKKGVAKVTTPKLPDSAEFGYPYYLSWLQRQIYGAWLYPSEVPSGKNVLKAVMVLAIKRDGGISWTKLQRTSGNDVFDRSVLRAVEAAAPFPPLPDGYEKDTLSPIYLSFEYHE